MAIVIAMWSKGGNFLINFVSQEGNLKIMPSKGVSEYDGIVLGRINQSFTINVQSKDGNSSYAAKLFIDDQEVIKVKTFKGRGNFFGFKRGNGLYDRFLFSMPQLISDDHLKSKEVKGKGKKMGEIRIIFFKAEEIWKKLGERNNGQNSKQRENPEIDYVQVPLSDCKALHARSLSVGTGKSFQVDSSAFTNVAEKAGPHKGMVKVARASFDEPEDYVVIRYSHPATLMMMGLLNPLNEEDIKYFPLSFVKNNTLILECFYQALATEKYNSSEIKVKLDRLFESHSLKDLYPGGISELCRATSAYKDSINKADINNAVQSGKFLPFCIEPEQAAASEKEERKFLGRRPEPVREKRPYHNPSRQQAFNSNYKIERPKPERSRNHRDHENQRNVPHSETRHKPKPKNLENPYLDDVNDKSRALDPVKRE